MGEGPLREKGEQPQRPDAEQATQAQLLMALMDLDPLTQETMIAHRLASLPTGQDGQGPPANIPRMIRGPWAHHLRKLGIFCIPELATHELLAPDPVAAGFGINHVGADMSEITVDSLWERVKAMNPGFAEQFDAARSAKDPALRKAMMDRLYAQMPAEQKLIAQRLLRESPENLTPR